MAYKPQAAPVMAAPNVVPMADVMLVLLIIFMVVTPMLQHGQSVNMAKVNNAIDMPDADRDDAVIVAVSQDGVDYLGTTKTNIDDLTQQVRKLIADRGDKTVFVRSDERAHYGSVVQVVDAVRAAGCDKVGLLTERRTQASQQSAPPPPPPPAD
ncbi:MAG TPA: biopolymer transporter ExbD [Methylomirabilota bacterium]|nr:biopolymer transporter ExbD [Methylomirabilota bacterium]